MPMRSSYWTTLIGGIPGFFEPNPRAFLGAHVPLGADHAGYYSTEPLRKTLDELVDFSLINRGTPRLTVGAAHVRTSMMRYFDSREMEITARPHHGVGRAAAGLPGRAHRRRALLGRRHPLQHADRAHLRRPSAPQLADLRRASVEPDGTEPETIWEILNRHKDIQYSSRIASHIVRQRETHKLRHVITELARICARAGEERSACQGARRLSLPTRMHVVRLLAPRLDNENHTKDIDFSPRHPLALGGRAMPTPCARSSDTPWIGEFDPLDGVILHEPMVENSNRSRRDRCRFSFRPGAYLARRVRRLRLRLSARNLALFLAQALHLQPTSLMKASK